MKTSSPQLHYNATFTLLRFLYVPPSQDRQYSTYPSVTVVCWVQVCQFASNKTILGPVDFSPFPVVFWYYHHWMFCWIFDNLPTTVFSVSGCWFSIKPWRNCICVIYIFLSRTFLYRRLWVESRDEVLSQPLVIVMTNAINFVFFAFFNISDVVTATTFFVSLVMPTVADPVPGWTGNLYGPIGVMAAAGMGIMRVMLADVSVKLDIVPADYVVNALICAAWEVDYKRYFILAFRLSPLHPLGSRRHNCAEVSIYNCVGGLDKAVNGGKILCSTINYEYPASNPLWATFLIITRNVYWFTFLTFIFHNIPGYFIDCYMYMAGRKERYNKRLHKISSTVQI